MSATQIPKSPRGTRRQRRVDLRERPVAVRPVALVRLDDELPDELLARQAPGRDERRLGSRGDSGPDVHPCS